MGRKRTTPEPTQARVKELFNYDQETGLFTWRVSRSNRASVGAIAGYKCDRGYIWIGVDRVVYLAHRLAWLWMEGEMPVEIDHEDTIKSNNRWDNLRKATRGQNNVNADAHKNSMTGVKGVTFIHENKDRPYHAYAYRDGVRYSFGYHATLEAAHAARFAGAKTVHGEFARA
jgi:hypothetical protein